MPTTTTVNFLYLGNFAEMDTDEGDFDNEVPGVVLGVHSAISIAEIDLNDANDDSVIADDEGGSGDDLTYDVGGGPTTTPLDSTAIYNAEILLGDGSTITTQVVIIQAANGDVFLSELSTQLDNLNIQSVNLTSADSSNYSGITPGSSIENSAIVCFCPGTMIATPSGERPVEDLDFGDLVLTADHGAQPVIWTNKTHTQFSGRRAPICFPTGSLGHGVPTMPLKVSPQHRVLVSSKIVERMYDTPEVLINAKTLLGIARVRQDPSFLPVTYHHFACQNHEVIFANGAEAETFYPGPEALKTLTPDAHQTLMSRRPSSNPARPFAFGKKARLMIERHVKNRKPLQADVDPEPKKAGLAA